MRIFMACSAKDAVDPKYKDLASIVSTALAKENKLVFGGVDSGMMGKCFMTFKFENSKTKAVADIVDQDFVKDLDVDAYEITPTTFDRTKEIYKSSEAAIILPGGVGTLREFFALIDEKRTKNSHMPIILFNYDNFYTPLLNTMKKMYEQNFISEGDLKLFDIVTDVKSLELYFKKINMKG